MKVLGIIQHQKVNVMNEQQSLIEVIKSIIPELVKQAPSVIVLIIILLHQQQQINLLLEKCIVITQSMPK
jgi:hypothetical protein